MHFAQLLSFAWQFACKSATKEKDLKELICEKIEWQWRKSSNSHNVKNFLSSSSDDAQLRAHTYLTMSLLNDREETFIFHRWLP
jgi:hypothetical protein